jgi:hypothetical protein
VVDYLVRCLETDPLTDAVIVQGLGPRPVLDREGKGRGLANAVGCQRLLGLRPGEAAFTAAAISRKARISEHPSSTVARRVNLAIRPSFLSNAEQS